MKSKKFIENYFDGIKNISSNINYQEIEKLAKAILKIKKQKGRIFFLGVGGSAGNASHAVNDFRKLCEIECYTPTDNVSELSARINDDGWKTSFSEWLRVSNLNKKDAIFIFSVGGGNLKKKVSVNIINALKYANINKIKSICFVGKKDGYAFKNSSISVYFNVYNKKLLTPISEAMQALMWHAIVSDPELQLNKTKW